MTLTERPSSFLSARSCDRPGPTTPAATSLSSASGITVVISSSKCPVSTLSQRTYDEDMLNKFTLTQAPMHPALCLPEVLLLICAFLEHKSDRLDLANVARCSKLLHEISIGVIWRDTSLLHLIKCFPEDTWSIVGSEMVREPRSMGADGFKE